MGRAPNFFQELIDMLVKTAFHVNRITFWGFQALQLFWRLYIFFYQLQPSSGKIFGRFLKTAVCVSRGTIWKQTTFGKVSLFQPFLNFEQFFSFFELNFFGRVPKTAFYVSRGALDEKVTFFWKKLFQFCFRDFGVEFFAFYEIFWPRLLEQSATFPGNLLKESGFHKLFSFFGQFRSFSGKFWRGFSKLHSNCLEEISNKSSFFWEKLIQYLFRNSS